MAFAYPGLPYPSIDPKMLLLHSLLQVQHLNPGQQLNQAQPGQVVQGFENNLANANQSPAGMHYFGPGGAGIAYPDGQDPSQDPAGELSHQYQSHVVDAHHLATQLAQAITRVRGASPRRLRPSHNPLIGRRLPNDPAQLTFHHAPVSNYPSGPRGQQ